MKIPATLDLQCGKKSEQKCTGERMDAYYDDSLTEQSTANAGIRIAYLDESDLCLSDSDQSPVDNLSVAEVYNEATTDALSPDSTSSNHVKYFEAVAPRDPDGWQNQADYLFTACSFALNTSSILHFASCAAQNDGGAFCVAYLVLVFVCGLPMIYLETCIGQYARGGPVLVWRIMPLAKGISWAMIVVSTLISMYDSVLMSWSLYYFGVSVIFPLPWVCGKEINNGSNSVCGLASLVKNSQHESSHWPTSLAHEMNKTNSNLVSTLYRLPSGLFFQQKLLLQSENSPSGNWQLVICLLLTWILVFLILIKGTHSMGKVMYLTGTLPYLLLLPMLVCVCSLEGALPGVKFFLTPGWDALQKLQVWSDAAKQLFFSLGLGTGSFSMMAGYTHFHSNSFRVSLLAVTVNFIGTEIAGLFMFAVYGVFTKLYKLPLTSLEIPALDLAFITFPEITSLMSFPPLWSVFFYLLLTVTSLNGILVFTQLIVSCLEVLYPMHERRHYKMFWLFVICVLIFICSLFLLTQADLFTDKTMDVYIPYWSLLFISFSECFILMWLYGPRKFLRNITDMTGSIDRFFWKWMWRVLTPLTILGIAGFAIALTCSSIRRKDDALHIRQIIGWLLTLFPFLIITIYFFHKVIQEFSKGDDLKAAERFKKLTATPPEWGPGLLSEEELQNEQCSDYVIQQENNRRPANALAILTANLYLPDIRTMVEMERSESQAGVPTGGPIAGVAPSGGGYLADAISLSSNDSTNDSMTVEENKLRGYWNRRLDFMLSCLGYVIGLGNVWRFPYLVHRNGGGAFFIPYIIMLVFCGIPLAYMELAYGQYGSLGPITVWKAVPFFKGIGYGMVLLSGLIAIYYTMVTAWAFHFLFSSMTASLPWRSCTNTWNTKYCKAEKYHLPNCSDVMNHSKDHDLNLSNISVPINCIWNASFSLFAENSSSGSLEANVTFNSPSEEYFYIWVLHTSRSIGNLGAIRWQLALCLLLCWVIVFLCVFKGIKSSGKVVYLIVTFPYIIMFVLLIRGLTVDGHLEGIKFYLTPKWEKLKKVQVWSDAAAQVFFSLSLCWGGLSTLSSYNKFHNNIYRDAVFVCLGDSLMSVLAGFSVFAVMGVLGKELNTSVENVIASDVGLAFTAYPAALTYLPAAPVWAILFFLMLVMMGLSTEITIVETVVTAIIDEKIEVLRKKRVTVLFIVCVLLYFLGLPMTTEGGLYILQLMDECTGFPVMIIGISMCVAIAWVYGVKKFCGNIKHMIRHEVSLFWRILWLGVSPTMLLFVLIFSVVDYKPLAEKFTSSSYPFWSDITAFLLMTIPVVSIPLCMIIKLCMAEGTLRERLRYLCEPEPDWGPALEKHWEHVEYVPTVFTCSGSFAGFGVEKLPITSVSDHVEFTTSRIRVPGLSETTSLISLSPKIARNRKQMDMRQRAILNHAYSNPQCNSSPGSTERLTRPLLYDQSDEEIIIVPRNRVKVLMHDVATQTDTRNLDLANKTENSWQNARMSRNSIFSQSSTISLDRNSIRSDYSANDYRGSTEKIKMYDSREELRRSKGSSFKRQTKFNKEHSLDASGGEEILCMCEPTDGKYEVQIEKFSQSDAYMGLDGIHSLSEQDRDTSTDLELFTDIDPEQSSRIKSQLNLFEIPVDQERLLPRLELTSAVSPENEPENNSEIEAENNFADTLTFTPGEEIKSILGEERGKVENKIPEIKDESNVSTNPTGKDNPDVTDDLQAMNSPSEENKNENEVKSNTPGKEARNNLSAKTSNPGKEEKQILQDFKKDKPEIKATPKRVNHDPEIKKNPSKELKNNSEKASLNNHPVIRPKEKSTVKKDNKAPVKPLTSPTGSKIPERNSEHIKTSVGATAKQKETQNLRSNNTNAIPKRVGAEGIIKKYEIPRNRDVVPGNRLQIIKTIKSEDPKVQMQKEAEKLQKIGNKKLEDVSPPKNVQLKLKPNDAQIPPQEKITMKGTMENIRGEELALQCVCMSEDLTGKQLKPKQNAETYFSDEAKSSTSPSLSSGTLSSLTDAEDEPAILEIEVMQITKL